MEPRLSRRDASRRRLWRAALCPVLLLACAPAVVRPIVLDGGDDATFADGAAPDVSVADAKTSTDVPETPPDVLATDAPPGRDVTPLFDQLAPDIQTAPEDAPVAEDLPPGSDVVILPDVVAPADAPSPFTCPVPLQRALSFPTDVRSGAVSGRGALADACAAANGPEHVFPFTLTTRTGVQLDTDGSMFDTVLYVRSRCDSPMGQLACNDDVAGNNNAFVRAVLDPGTYYAVVDTFGDGTGGMYSLRARTFTPEPNATCAAAIPLMEGVASRGDVFGGGDPGAACDADAWGPQIHYTVSVPAGRAVVLTAVPRTAGWSAIVRARTACDATVCVASGRSASEGTGAVARWENRSGAPVTLQVSVASTTGRVSGAATLTAAFEDLPPAPANAVCANASAVASGARINGESLERASSRLGGVCVPAAQGPSRFYRVTVPARSTLLATATGRDGMNPALRLLDACDAATCRASVNASGDNGREVLTHVNNTDAAQTLVLAAGSVSPTPAGAYDLAVDIAPPPTNTTCASAAAVTGSVRLALQNAARGTENATGACLDAATGTQLFYAVTVPPGQTLSARATPYAGMDPVLRVISACGATTCLASANSAGGGAAESLSWVNSTTTAQRVVLAAGGASNATNGVFDLDLTVAREYTLSTTAVACDDMTGATAIPGVNGDDTVSAARDLPFSLSFYGETELEYTVSSNGLLQLFPALPATGSSALENTAIPNAAAPNGFVAAFWDDLFPEPMISDVTARTLGTAPSRRFVVQWRNFSHYADRMARITMQAKLFETTGVIELHYCTLTPGAMAPLVTGSSATIGVESRDGRNGRMHSHERAMSVSATTALRFTP
jgi:hypothetical protein